MPVKPLPPKKLCRVCDPAQFTFTTTNELTASSSIIGQPRGTKAIEFGIGIQSEGFNIYILGPVGTGRATAIEQFLQDRTSSQLVPDDWVFVHNFVTSHQPRAIQLPPGQGADFKERMRHLIACLKSDLPEAFNTDTYQEAVDRIRQEVKAQQNEMMQDLHHKAASQGFGLMETPSGFALIPVQDGKPIPPEILGQLPLDQRQAMEKQHEILVGELHDILYQVHQLETEARNSTRQLDREVAAAAVLHHFESLRAQYQDEVEIRLYLDEVHQDALSQIDDFAPSTEAEEPRVIDLRRYEVNLLVENGRNQGAPVIIEQNPTYHNLFGRIEYEMQRGVVTTHFTNVKSGSLHRANGGYLIMDAYDLFKEQSAWEALKRTLKAGQIQVQLSATMDGGQVLAKSLDPEPIPLKIKIILMGSPYLYYMLHEQDEDFRTLFKVRADFDTTMPLDEANLQSYATFIATRCHQEKLIHFNSTAVARVVEYGSRLAEHQGKLSTRFGAVTDLVREASYWAGRENHDPVTAVDVQRALDERVHRASQLEERIRDQILRDTLYIATEDSVIGQVNGLSVIDTGEYTFGQPGRITARTFMGKGGVVHIERETEMSGPIHEKGVLTLTGYLGGQYAQQQPLSLTASLTFEQNYTGVDGDSASSTELYALLSSLSGLPLKQGIAVTGSVNQRGEVQPIGGVNEKIEGFFQVCRARGFTGEQGVIIPASNVDELMLFEDVIAAVAAGQFHIWPVQTIDEGIELLTGLPAGERSAEGDFPKNTVHYAVQKRLLILAQDLKAFGDGDS